VKEEDILRSFNKTVSMLLEQDSGFETTQEVGNQLVYLGNRYDYAIWAKLIAYYANKETLCFLVRKYLLNQVSGSDSPRATPSASGETWRSTSSQKMPSTGRSAPNSSA
jgi:hypothetical protein